jgi:RNA methyltransferase, TrmH family
MMAGSSSEAEPVVLEGFHPLKHALRFGASIEAVLTADPAALEALAGRLAPDVLPSLRALTLRVVSTAELQRMAGGRSHGSVDAVTLARPPVVDRDRTLQADAPVLLLEEPTHFGNIGAVVRVAAAASAAAVLTTGALDPWHPAALRGSAGLHFALPVWRVDDIAELLGGGRIVVAADPEGTHAPGALPARALLALGSERRGLSDHLLQRAAQRVRIPMRAGVSSLNLATAAAVLLYARG